ncbi:MAG: hypothetical protein ACHQPI_12800 [Thermoanaerobaculia bacterium]
MRFRRLAILPLVAVLAALVPLAAQRTRTNFLLGLAGFHDDEVTARRRIWGDAYVDAIEAIRRAIPEGAEYLIVVDKRPGTPDYVAYDLAPRRPLYLPNVFTADELRRVGPPPGAPPWVVIASRKTDPPRLLATAEFFRGAAAR